MRIFELLVLEKKRVSNDKNNDLFQNRAALLKAQEPTADDVIGVFKIIADRIWRRGKKDLRARIAFKIQIVAFEGNKLRGICWKYSARDYKERHSHF